jgi:predicted short-subunit dehydrogenase-like oxidoreductase (DUF2520 family)
MRVKRLAIVGTGRLGTSLALALASSASVDEAPAGAAPPIPAPDSPAQPHGAPADGARDWRVCAIVARHPDSPSAERAARLTGVAVTPLARSAAVLTQADLVVLAVTDRAIETVARQLAEADCPLRAVAHTAGSVSAEALAPLAERGVATGSIHPLQTFAEPDASAFSGVWCCIDGHPGIMPLLRNLASCLGMHPFTVQPAERARYHAAASLASNALVALAAAAAEAMPLSDGLLPLLPLMRTTLANLERIGLPGALTGPVERGDVGTVRRHLDALAGLPLVDRVYRALADATVAVALRKGSLDPDAARALKTLLRANSHAHGGD